MTFYIYDIWELSREIHFVSEDYTRDYFFDFSEFCDEVGEVVDDDALRESAEESVKARFGTESTIDWRLGAEELQEVV